MKDKIIGFRIEKNEWEQLRLIAFAKKLSLNFLLHDACKKIIKNNEKILKKGKNVLTC